MSTIITVYAPPDVLDGHHRNMTNLAHVIAALEHQWPVHLKAALGLDIFKPVGDGVEPDCHIEVVTGRTATERVATVISGRKDVTEQTVLVTVGGGFTVGRDLDSWVAESLANDWDTLCGQNHVNQIPGETDSMSHVAIDCDGVEGVLIQPLRIKALT